MPKEWLKLYNWLSLQLFGAVDQPFNSCPFIKPPRYTRGDFMFLYH